MLLTWLLVLLGTLCFVEALEGVSRQTKKKTNPEETGAKNVIHIIIDDLRTELGSYTDTHKIHTPNMDALASRGVTFDRAYAQQALCNPSRASFMSGRYPHTTGVYNLNNNWRTVQPRNQLLTSLPGQFLEAGYLSLGAGKTYHDTVQNGVIDAIFQYDGPRSWSREALPYRNPCWVEGVDCRGCPGTHWKIGNVTTDWCVLPEGDLSDVLTVDHAIELLSVANSTGKPGFYLAVGFHKPHLPWIFKQEHFDMYDIEEIEVAKNPTLDESIPPIAFNDCDSDSPYSPLSDDDARTARRAYYAAVTGMDEQIGRFIQALEESGLASSTAIVLHSDHGWSLGENGQWRKNTNWESALRVPLIISVPWEPSTHGTRSSELAELVDIMPTLADLAGISTPSKIGDRLWPIEGTSLVPALKGDNVKSAAFSLYPRKTKDDEPDWYKNGADHADVEKFTHMGYSVRTNDWRYTEWRMWSGDDKEAVWSDDGLYARELYDWRDWQEGDEVDYDLFEVVNVAEDEANAKVCSELSSMLNSKFA